MNAIYYQRTKMDFETEYITQSKINSFVKKLNIFLDNASIKTSKGNPYTNISNQTTGETYHISTDINQSISSDNFIIKSPIDELMMILEECRKTNAKLNISELQSYHIPKTTNDNSIKKPNNDDIFISKSGIDLDFDIYQKESTRVIGNTHYCQLINQVVKSLLNTLDLTSCSDPAGIVTNINSDDISIKFHCCILRKPNIVETDHTEYGKCYKESFRVRIPSIKITKEYKKYLIHSILEKGILSYIFTDIQIINPWNTVLDPLSASHPVMILGSSKRNTQIPHEFYRLYSIIHTPKHDMLIVNENHNEFDPDIYNGPPIKIIDPDDRRKKIIQKIPPKYKYNLCHELSLNFESPKGLIKKREFNPKSSFEVNIKTHSERHNGNSNNNDEIYEVNNSIADLGVRNYEACYLRQILDILSPERVKSYETWRWMIYILAWTNPDYKSLAIYFSQRLPESWSNGGSAQLEENWNWAINHPRSNTDEDRRTINTIFSWAKEDNPVKYEQLQDFNAFMKLKILLFHNAGRLNESHLAEVLKVMYGKKFVCDENPYSTRVTERRWYEFVFPTDDIGIIKCSIYKWRREKGKPDSLDKYISKKLPSSIEKIREWIDLQIVQKEADEESQKYYELMKKNMKDTIFSLGTECMIKKILSRCEVEFRTRGFEESLDTDRDVIGTGNGVLKVYPSTEMIQRYHEIPITRSTNVDYENMFDNSIIKVDDIIKNLNKVTNSYLIELIAGIRRLFANEDDAFIKTMCYLASSLDGRKRQPLFFIWLGEGQNGKSFLLELHINTLHEVVKGGYGAKLNVAFFTQDRKGGGPDSEKMMLKHARFAYCSESEPGETLHMSKIKEFTSETLSANEKHQTQDMFEANCHYVFCSNNDPRITGRDWGTWRRILVYIFKMKFISKPDPENPYEYKDDKKFSEEIPKSDNFKKAYFSLLVYFYEVYRDIFKSDLSRIESLSIDKDTKKYRNEQDTISRFVNEQIIYIGKNYPINTMTNEVEKVADIPLTEIASKYIEWYVATIDSNKLIQKEIIKAFKSTTLKRFIIMKKSTQEYLTEHRILNIGEENNYNNVNVGDDTINPDKLSLEFDKENSIIDENIDDNIIDENIDDSSKLNENSIINENIDDSIINENIDDSIKLNENRDDSIKLNENSMSNDENSIKEDETEKNNDLDNLFIDEFIDEFDIDID